MKRREFVERSAALGLLATVGAIAKPVSTLSLSFSPQKTAASDNAAASNPLSPPAIAAFLGSHLDPAFILQCQVFLPRSGQSTE